jgi:hypothetical protein
MDISGGIFKDGSRDTLSQAGIVWYYQKIAKDG